MSSDQHKKSGRKDDLERKVDALSANVDALSTNVDSLSASVDLRFNEVDKRFDEVAKGFVEQRQYTEFAFDRLTGEMRGGFNRIERKLDQFIDTQSKTNELAERRLSALESTKQP